MTERPAPPPGIPVYLDEQLYFRLQERADREHTTVNALVIRIVSNTLGPPEPPDPRISYRRGFGGPER